MIATILVLSALGVAAPSAQQQEGIKVHGDWVIEVRNPDGSLVNRYEFKNALVGAGHTVLSRLLARTGSSGGWQVLLSDDAQQNPCKTGTSRAPCMSGEVPPTTNTEFGWVFNTLQVGNPQTPAGPDTTKVQLSGTVTASFDGSIQQVTTALHSCTPDTLPVACDRGSTFDFSSRVLAAPIAVAAGQIVQFKVIFSFS